MKKYCLTLLLISILGSCMDRVDNRNLKIYNESNTLIYFFVSQNDFFADPYINYSEDIINSNYSVKQDSFADFVDRPIFWNEYIKNCNDGKIRVFIVAKDSVDKYDLKKVITNSIYTKKFLLDIDSLNKINWSIMYEDK